jgi:mRNA interferase MazF
MNRGDVVTIRFPYADLSQTKVRPALVLQNDRDNQRLHDSIFAMISGNVSRVHVDTQFLVDCSPSPHFLF